MSSLVQIATAHLRAGVLVLSITLVAGCGTSPKPRELEAFELLRADPRTRRAAEVAPDIMRRADQLLAQSRAKWESDDLAESRHLALLGNAKVEHAIALADQADAKARIAQAKAEQESVDAQIDKLERELDALREQLGLLQRIEREQREKARLQAEIERQKNLASEEQARLAGELQGARARAEVGEKIKAAELVLKEAEGVDAATHAAEDYRAAVELLTRARSELNDGQLDPARTSADLARQRATVAFERARPLHSERSQAAQRLAEIEALNRDAAAIPFVEVRREARGALQRLVLHIPAALLFAKPTDTMLAAGAEGILGQIAQLARKHPEIPLQIVGHTDSRGRQEALLARSLARAQSVYTAFLAHGISPNKLSATGRGGEEPISDNRTKAGRDRNARIEVVFMYQ